MKTWKDEASGKCWLSDFLPLDIPDARILTWGYPAKTHSLKGALAIQSVNELGKCLVSGLCEQRASEEVMILSVRNEYH